MKARDLIRQLTDAGAVFLRQKGSHQVWRLPNGAGCVIVVVHNQTSEVSAGALAALRRKLRVSGAGSGKADA